MSPDDMRRLVDAGWEWKVECVDGRLVVDWHYEYVFGPEQQRAAAALGVEVPSCLDVALADPELRAEAIRRLGAGG